MITTTTTLVAMVQLLIMVLAMVMVTVAIHVQVHPLIYHDLAVDVMKIRFEDRGEYLALMNVCEAEAQTRAFQATGKTRPHQLVGYYLIMPVQRVPRCLPFLV